MTLKELRMWHWRQVIAFRQNAANANKRANDKRCSIHSHMNFCRLEINMNEMANTHMKAVQCLNDHVPGTAEADVFNDNARAEAVKKGALCYYSQSGMLCNLNGSRSIFDDVDE